MYTLTIPAGAPGGDPTQPTEICFDKNISRSVTPRVLTATFGDGYEQRVADGLNPKDETFNLSFTSREASEINKIAAFLDSRIGKNFEIKLTNLSGVETIKVVFTSYNISYPSTNYHNLTLSARRVYEICRI